MRVMLSCPYSLSVFGGVQGQVLGLAHALRGLGVDARIIAPCDGPPPEPGITTVGPSTRVPSNGSVAPIAAGRPVARRTLEAIRSFGPDVLHLHEPFSPGSNHAALMGTTVPVVGTFHSANPGRNGWYETLRSPLQALLKRLAVRTAVSPEAQRIVELGFGIRCEIVPNGIEIADFAVGDAWPAPTPAILFVGRHEPRKGLEVLLDAFEGLDRDAVLWVVGDGPQTAALRGRGVSRVEWLGRVSDAEKQERLRGATIACFPSLDGESFGLVLLEAMAAGTALVASEIDGYRDVSRAGVEAALVPPGDAGSLRDVLGELLDRPDRRSELVAAGRARAAEFSMVKVAERFVAIYEQVIAGAPMPESPHAGVGRRAGRMIASPTDS
jgi:phosphatidyl-myo-inositol alpha-mannosyltransferase